MTTVKRTYENAEDAQRAVAALESDGFPAASIRAAPVTRWSVAIDPAFGMGQRATDVLERFGPLDSGRRETARDPGIEAISQLSGPVSPGAISTLSGWRSPGAISRLSGWRPPGAIASLSRAVSPGAIAKLSGWRSPGAISRLSRSRPATDGIARLSRGWFLSDLFGLPLLTRSQAPIEPSATLLTERPRPLHNVERSNVERSRARG